MSLIGRTIGLIGTIAAGLTSLTSLPPQALEQHPVRVVMPAEPISSTPKADRLTLFDKRWDQMPTVAEIRVIPLERPEPPPLPVARAENQPEPDRHRHRVEQREQREDHPKNVCERHHLRKVSIRGGRSWRCRK